MKRLVQSINLLRICIYVMLNFYTLRKNASAIRRIRTSEKHCIVVGNGPSLSDSLARHRASLRTTAKMCLNDMILTPVVQDLRPEYYVLLDPLYFTSDASAQYIQLGKDIVHALETTVSWDMVLFIPHGMRFAAQFKRLTKINPHISIYYFNNHFPATFPSVNRWLYDRDLCSPHCQNVMVAAIFLMLRLNFKRIFLLGADHSWTKNMMVTKDNIVSYQNSHFYDPAIEVKPFFKGDAQGSVFSMSEILRLYSLMFEGYEILHQYASTLNAEVLNCTPGSFIDSFPKSDSF